MEQVLSYIDAKYLKVDEGEETSANKQLQAILKNVTDSMKTVSPLFNALFETHLYAGSSYDGLKIGKPDEYDIDFKLYLPEILHVQVLPTNRPGFVSIKLTDWNRLVQDRNLYSVYKELENLKDNENYLSHTKINQWMLSIVTRATQKFTNVSVKVSGPAVTLVVKDAMNIDLVAVFRIPGQKWPVYPVRQNAYYSKPDYVVVPKTPKVGVSPTANLERYWRLSFPEQERARMSGYYHCKPALRLIKKLRDTRDINIPSYFIKTIFLWEIENNTKHSSFWNSSITNVFVEMLKTFKKYIETGNIPYYWDKRHNLLEARSGTNLSNIRQYLDGMIQAIERSRNTDSFIVAKYVLSTVEYNEVRRHFGYTV